MKIARHLIVARVAGAIALGITVAGCKSPSPDDMSFGAIADDLSPNMRSTAERPVDIDRNIAIQEDLNRRGIWSDLGRVFYTDHPSRLSPFPIISTSGQPR